MVKILKCHNFKSQKILKEIKNEPVCMAGGKDQLFVGTSLSTVEVFRQELNSDGEGEWRQFCQFQTGAPATHIEYNERGDYVTTIERKSSRQSEVVSVKVYLNWSIGHDMETYRTRVRVAGLGYRSSNVDTGKRLEVVDIPCDKHPAEGIAVCHETGNLVVISDKTVKIYHLVEKTIPNNSTTFMDVILFLSLLFTYPVTHVSLCEDYIACSSTTIVQVFQITMTNDGRGQVRDTESMRSPTSPIRGVRRSSSIASSSLNLVQQKKTSSQMHKGKGEKHLEESIRFSQVGERSSSTPSPAFVSSSRITNSMIEDDTDFIHWDFALPSSTGSDKTIRLKGLENLGQKVRTSPYLPSARDHRGGSHNTTGTVSLRQVLYRYLDDGDQNWVQVQSWIHLQLVPTYLTRVDENVAMRNENLMWSPRRSSLVGMSCLLSSPLHGYVYSLMPESSLLSTYQYTSDALQLSTNGSFVYVLVKTGLETYTCRWHIAAFHNVQKMDHLSQTCPFPTEDICMCGLQTFIGPRQTTLTGSHVILLNKFENAWNVNILKEPGAADVYHDIINFADKFQHSAMSYHHLLQEGHMALRSSLIGQYFNQSDVATVEDLVKESCALLGEFYALPHCDDWYLCLPYFTMSGLSPVAVVRQVLQQREHSKQGPYEFGQGLAQYLKYVIFSYEDPMDLKESESDMILRVCAEVIPGKLADVILSSRIQNYNPNTALQLLSQCVKSRSLVDTKTKTKEGLAMVSLYLQTCDLDTAQSTLLSIDKVEVIEVCVTHHQFLRKGLTDLSPLSHFMKRHCPEMLVYILVTLYDSGDIPMDLAITLLQGRSNSTEIHMNTHVISYLEALLNDDRTLCLDEAANQLCEIYLQRLLEWRPPSIRHLTPSMKFKLPKPCGHFGRRHGWLDDLPPFDGAQSISAPCKYVVSAGNKRAGSQLLQCQRSQLSCTCFLCNEDLLKLQSLLCWPKVNRSLCQKLLSSLRSLKVTWFHPSLQILCHLATDLLSAVTTIVQEYQNVAASFAASVLKQDPDQWALFLKSLIDNAPIKGKNPDISSQKDTWQHNLTDVLKQMAISLKPEQFLEVMPSTGNLFFFSPFIKMCIDNQQNIKLRHKILELGEKLATVQVKP